MADQFLTTAQIADRLDVSKRTVQAWLQWQEEHPDDPPILRGAFKAQRDWLVPVDALVDFEKRKRGRPSRLIGQTVKTNDGRHGTVIYLTRGGRAMLQLGTGDHVSYPIDDLEVDDGLANDTNENDS